MKFYILLPEYHKFKKYEWYFLRVIDFAARELQTPIIFCGEPLSSFDKLVHGLTMVQLSEVERRVTSKDIVFDFYGAAISPCLKHFQLCTSTLDCCLYSSLYLKEPTDNASAKASFPVELLSNLWFEILHRPFPELDHAAIQCASAGVNQGMPSEMRAKIAWLAQQVVADSYTSALESILLGKAVDYPGQSIDGSDRDYFLTSRLLPSSVLTDKEVFHEFVGSLQTSPLVSDEVFRLHHLSLMANQTIDKQSALSRKIRKFKRDPVLFFYDAFKKRLG